MLSRLAELLADKVLHRPAEKTWNALIVEGNQRVDNLVPPGFLDADKGDQHAEGAAGDFLVYVQACHEAKSRQMDLIIVTNDEKEDWWWRRGPDMIGPRQEMTKEFFDQTGRRLFLMRASDLLNRSQVLDVEVNPQSARDADVSRSDISELGKWTAEAVEMLLQRLRGEGRRDLADIINAAAAAGGSISREEIYVLCEYRDDRKLRGITRPAAVDAHAIAPVVARGDPGRRRPAVHHAGHPTVSRKAGRCTHSPRPRCRFLVLRSSHARRARRASNQGRRSLRWATTSAPQANRVSADSGSDHR